MKRNRLIAIFWKSYGSSGWFSICEGFSKMYWMVLILVMVLIYIMLNFIKKFESPKLYSYCYLINSGIAIGKALLGNSFEEEILFPKKSSRSGSILVFTISLTGYMLYSFYTSCLVMFLAVKEVKIPFNSVRKLPQFTDFKVGKSHALVVRNSIAIIVFSIKFFSICKYNKNYFNMFSLLCLFYIK